jgi:hypothetical protein
MHRVLMAGNFVAPCAAAAWLMVCAAYAGDAERVSPYEAKVVAPGAPILSGPGPAFYAVDTLAEGDVVEIHREQSGGWLGIRPPEGSFSWVFERHVQLLDDGLGKIDKDDVASRIGSRLTDDRNAVQVRLKKGEIVEILDEQSVDGQTWYKIAPPAGEFRWIHERYVVRANGSRSEGSASPPIVTVPVVDDRVSQEADPITLVADSQQAVDESWRAAPPGSFAQTVNDGDADAAPPLVADVSAEGAAAPGAIGRTPPSATSEVDSVPRASGDVEPAADTAAPTRTTRAMSDSLARQLTDLEMRLSRIVAEPPATWRIEPLASEAHQLLTESQSASDRNAVQITQRKIDRFASIGRRYQQMGLAGTGSGDPRITWGAGSGDQRTTPGDPRTGAAQIGQVPITPIPGPTTDNIGPDGQRYDAIGILRPVVSKRSGAPQFALLNERNQVVSFVTPTPDMNLQPYIGHRVGVTGTRGYIPEFQRAHVTAGRVAPLGRQLLR